MSSDDPEDSVELIFDGQCPVCTAYSEAAVRRDSKAAATAIDARSDHSLVREALARGLDLDEGMVAVSGGRFYHGAEALRFMAGRNRSRTIVGMLNRAVFSRTRLSRIFYPLLRAGRNGLLRIKGVPPIRDGRDPARPVV